MLKWGRNYKIVFEIGERKALTEYIPQEEVIVQYPTTLRLNITSGINSSNVAQGSFQLYNLPEDTRAKLWKDNFNQTKYITMYVYAGYQSDMPLIYHGDIMQCYSFRDSGGVDYITDIQANDGSYVLTDSYANRTFSKGTELPNIIKTLLEDVPLYNVGYITKKAKPLPKDRTFIGNTLDLLGREYGDFDVYIDKGELNILAKDETVPGYLPVITAESGLLGSPRRADQFLVANMIFEPRLIIGQAVELLSDSLPFLNQIYKVITIAHQGVISPVESGGLTTTVTFLLGTAAFNELTKQAPSTYGGTPTTGIWSKPAQGRIESSFGPRKQPIPGASTNHKGIDIGAAVNAPVTAPANGKVYFANWNGGYGKCIQIDHGTIDGKQVTSLYGHLNTILVSYGQQVSQGQQIGLVGSTGNVSGPHLHFEVRENTIPVNPTKYIGAY